MILPSITALSPVAWAVGESSFKAPPVEEMKSKITLEDVTIGIDAFDTTEKAAKAFGKIDPNKYEVLPVLVVIKNGRKNPLRVAPLEVEYIIPGVGKIEALRTDEVAASGGGPSAPNLGPKPFPIPTRKKKNPLASPEIEVRAFAARMIAAGESASGFFYFNTRHRSTAKIYLNGFADVALKKEIFYFEIPFSG